MTIFNTNQEWTKLIFGYFVTAIWTQIKKFIKNEQQYRIPSPTKIFCTEVCFFLTGSVNKLLLHVYQIYCTWSTLHIDIFEFCCFELIKTFFETKDSMLPVLDQLGTMWRHFCWNLETVTRNTHHYWIINLLIFNFLISNFLQFFKLLEMLKILTYFLRNMFFLILISKFGGFCEVNLAPDFKKYIPKNGLRPRILIFQIFDQVICSSERAHKFALKASLFKASNC